MRSAAGKTPRLLDDCEIYIIFVYFAPKNRRSYGKAVLFQLRALCGPRRAVRCRPPAGRGGPAGHGERPRALFALPGRGGGAPAQREDPLRKQFRERGVSGGALRRTFADVLRAGQLCRRPDRDAGHRFESLRARVLPLRPVSAGDGRCRTPPRLAHAGHHERKRYGTVVDTAARLLPFTFVL